MSRTRPVVIWATLALLAALVVGFALGSAWSTRQNGDTWHTGTARTGIRQISIEYDGWTYGASESVGSWIDAHGTWHDSGRPACLRVPPGQQVAVRFQAREVTVNGTMWRPIVAIDCGG